MLKASGRVVEINDPFVVIETQHAGGCDSCVQASQGCRETLKFFFKPKNTTQIVVINPQAFKVGDQVLVGIEEHTVLLATLAVYLIPLIGLVSTMMSCHQVMTRVQLPYQDILSLFSGLFGLALGLIVAKKICGSFLNQPLLLTTPDLLKNNFFNQRGIEE